MTTIPRLPLWLAASLLPTTSFAANTPASRQQLCRVFAVSRSWSQETAKRAQQPFRTCRDGQSSNRSRVFSRV